MTHFSLSLLPLFPSLLPQKQQRRVDSTKGTGINTVLEDADFSEELLHAYYNRLFPVAPMYVWTTMICENVRGHHRLVVCLCSSPHTFVSTTQAHDHQQFNWRN
jgi:hypothetical protein